MTISTALCIRCTAAPSARYGDGLCMDCEVYTTALRRVREGQKLIAAGEAVLAVMTDPRLRAQPVAPEAPV